MGDDKAPAAMKPPADADTLDKKLVVDAAAKPAEDVPVKPGDDAPGKKEDKKLLPDSPLRSFMTIEGLSWLARSNIARAISYGSIVPVSHHRMSGS